MERLEEVKRRRAEAAKKREEDARLAELNKKKDEEKADALAGQREVAQAIFDLIKKKGVEYLTINQLAQDPECKKVLKPLTKKHNVKQLNRQFLEKFSELLRTEENGNNLHI